MREITTDQSRKDAPLLSRGRSVVLRERASYVDVTDVIDVFYVALAFVTMSNMTFPFRSDTAFS